MASHSKQGSLYRNLDENVDLSEFFNGKKNAVPLEIKVIKGS